MGKHEADIDPILGSDERAVSAAASAVTPPIDLAAIRERLANATGQQYWRSLDELGDTPEFQELLHREFPEGATEWKALGSLPELMPLAAAVLAWLLLKPLL